MIAAQDASLASCSSAAPGVLRELGLADAGDRGPVGVVRLHAQLPAATVTGRNWGARRSRRRSRSLEAQLDRHVVGDGVGVDARRFDTNRTPSVELDEHDDARRRRRARSGGATRSTCRRCRGRSTARGPTRASRSRRTWARVGDAVCRSWLHRWMSSRPFCTPSQNHWSAGPGAEGVPKASGLSRSVRWCRARPSLLASCDDLVCRRKPSSRRIAACAARGRAAGPA